MRDHLRLTPGKCLPFANVLSMRDRSKISFLLVWSLSLAGCAKRQVAVDSTSASPPVAVDAVRANAQQVPVVLSETGSFVAEESSDVAPAVAGRVVRTPVSVGAFVKTGDVICELDHKDAEFKVEQMRAQLAEATASVRQAQQRIGLGSGMFNPMSVPDGAAANA